MDEQKKTKPTWRKLSAFAMASDFAGVMARIDVEDVLRICPTWTPDQAAAFLREHGDDIGPAMVERGLQLLLLMLPRGPHA
jgi:hypothetical protein